MPIKNGDLKIEYVDTNSIFCHPENPRQGDIGAIIESIKRNGVYKPLTVQASTGHILAGNHTYKALRELGHEKIAVVKVCVNDGEALRIMLADNRTADLADYDQNILCELLESMSADLGGTGYTSSDLDDLLESLSPILPSPTVEHEMPISPSNKTMKCPKCGHEWTDQSNTETE